MSRAETSFLKTLKASLPKPIGRFLGFAFLQCWVLLVFSSFVPYGANIAGLSVAWTHCLGSLVSILVALAVLLCTPRLFPLSRCKELGLLLACGGVVGTLGVALASRGIIPLWCGWVSMATVSACATWLGLSWQEYFSTQGARSAVCGYALATLVGSLLFFAVGLLPDDVALVACVLMPLAADLTLRPHRGARFYSSTKRSITTQQLCANIAHDWSPRLMTVVTLVSLVYGVLRAANASSALAGNVDFWLRFAGSLSAASVVACVVVLSVRWHSLMKAFYLVIPLAALGVLAFALPLGGAVNAAVFLGACAFWLTNYLVWIVMLEKAFSLKLPVLGLLASLWSAAYVGVLAGQLLAAMWPFDAEYLNYLMLLALVAASLLLVGMNGKLTISNEVLVAPEISDTARRALDIAEAAKLSPRETEILTIWLAGHNAAYVEEALHISRNTVKTHLKHIYQKTGVESKEELLRMSREE